MYCLNAKQSLSKNLDSSSESSLKGSAAICPLLKSNQNNNLYNLFSTDISPGFSVKIQTSYEKKTFSTRWIEINTKLNKLFYNTMTKATIEYDSYKLKYL